MSDYKTDSWVNGHGILRGRATFIRKNVSLNNTRTADYPTVLLVSLIYHERADNGLPASDEELHRLDGTEETVADHFCSRHAALYGLCITRDGTRDLFLFLPTCPTEQELAAEFDACSPAVDFDFGVQHDPAWRPYKTMLPESDDVAPGDVSKSRSPWWKRLFGLP